MRLPLAALVLLLGPLGTGCSKSSVSSDDLGGGSADLRGSGGGGADLRTSGADLHTSGGAAWQTGNPDGTCLAGVPTSGQPVDTSSPTTVVGMGTPQSCTFLLLDAAVQQGGIITFDCGPDPVTILVTATLHLPITKDTVIDGGQKITLDGGGAVQILRFDSPNFRALETRVTLQHLALINGKATPTEAIPTVQQPSKCSQGWNDGEGGALYMRDGNLTIIDSIFASNTGAPLGPDTGGGGLYIVGSKHGVVVVHSTFRDNHASNGGGLGALFAELQIYDSLFVGNVATGHDANNNEPDKCSQINNGQNETGSGGNGGALYSDGASVDVTICGSQIVSNAAGTNAFGGGLFFTSNDYGGTLTFRDTTMTGNTGGYWTQVAGGSVTNAGTAVGTNAKSITIANSTLQGL